MSKTKQRLKPVQYDIKIGIDEIIPSTQEAFKDGEVDNKILKQETEARRKFINKYNPYIDKAVKRLGKDNFPTDEEVFVLIIQFFNSQSQYNKRDVDNLAKTLLDVLKGKVYFRDSQVKILVSVKQIEQKIPDNFAFVGVKTLDNWNVTPFLKSVGIEDGINHYFEVFKKQRAK